MIIRNTIHRSNWKGPLVATLTIAAAIHAQAQFFPGGGNFGGQTGGNRSRTSTRSYTPNGAVGDAYFSIDQDARKVVVIADENTLKQVSQIISNLDRPQPQVLIKVVFVEVTCNDGLDFGIEGGWGKPIGDGNSAAAATGFGLSPLSANLATNVNSIGIPISSFANGAGSTGAGIYQMLGTDYQVTIRAIAQAGRAKILSRPSILARNGQPATVTVGEEYPQVTGTTYTTTGVAVNSVSYTDVGVILKVTPFITSDGLVQMILQPQISAVDTSTSVTVSTGITASPITIRSADTVVVTPDHQTVVIGGLIENQKAQTDTKIPLLGDLPWLGVLFKHTVRTDVKRELIIFLTPHVVPAPSQLAALSAEERARSEIQKAVSQHELDRFLDSLPVNDEPAKDVKKPKKKAKAK